MRIWLPAVALLAVLLAACAAGPGTGELAHGGYPAHLSDGLRALREGDYAAASSTFRWLASRCEAGPQGRQAVLLLASANLDPRNPGASPDEGARLAAAFLGMPGADAGERAVAETLYLLALELGAGIPASPESRSAAGSSSYLDIANRFGECGRPGRSTAVAYDSLLPAPPDTALATRLMRTRAQRDSLAARLTELAAELARIRALLQGDVPPDTGGPDT